MDTKPTLWFRLQYEQYAIFHLPNQQLPICYEAVSKIKYSYFPGRGLQICSEIL